jgi:hypothetical protein
VRVVTSLLHYPEWGALDEFRKARFEKTCVRAEAMDFEPRRSTRPRILATMASQTPSVAVGIGNKDLGAHRREGHPASQRHPPPVVLRPLVGCGEGSAGDAVEGLASIGADRPAVVAEAPTER